MDRGLRYTGDLCPVPGRIHGRAVGPDRDHLNRINERRSERGTVPSHVLTIDGGPDSCGHMELSFAITVPLFLKGPR